MFVRCVWNCVRYTVFVLVAVVSMASDKCNADDRPNIVLMLADDVGQECLGCYGGESYATSQLDRLAELGIRFDHCYSMPVCHPTRIALLTGRYPFRFESKWGSFPTSAESMTVARLLQQSGYATGVFGKWQLALLRDDPQHVARLGFGHSDVFGWHEGPRYYQPMIYRNGAVRNDTLGHYGPDLYVRSLIEFMKANVDRPFFAFYSMALCHDVTDDLERPVPHGPQGRYDSYPEMIAEMDRAVGRVVGATHALGIYDKTLFLFVGDNGTPRRMILRADTNGKLVRVPITSKQNGREVPGGKGTLKDSGTRVPLIAVWPDKIKSKQRVDDLVDMSDFWPTILEVTGVKAPPTVTSDGVSFASRLVANEPSPRRYAYSERRDSFWVRTARWKLYSDGRLIDMSVNSLQEKEVKTPTAESEAAARQLREAMAELRSQPDPGERE